VDTVSIINSTFTCCIQSTVSLAGTVAYYPTNYPASALSTNRVPNATIGLSGGTNLSGVTLADGSYGLSNILVGGTYCVTPSKINDSPTANGVSSFDQILIQRLILGRSSQFPAGLWRFVPADYVFPSPQTPWTAPTNRW
jgi:hypothetical protein